MNIEKFEKVKKGILTQLLNFKESFSSMLFNCLIMKKNEGKCEQNEEDSSISTINEKIIGLLIERSTENLSKYPPSRILKLLHRSISEKHLNKDNFQSLKELGKNTPRGSFMNLGSSDVSMTIDSIYNCKKGKKRLYIESIIFPGTKYSFQIFTELDRVFYLIENLISLDNIYGIAAFFSMITSSTHGFPDANGRVSVGIAKFFIDKYSDKKLSLKKLEKNNEKFVEILRLCTISLLPNKENPHFLIKKQKKNSRRINISNYNLERKFDFLLNFKRNILLVIREFGNGLILGDPILFENLNDLEKLLKECSK